MLRGQTYESILSDTLALPQGKIDTRPGSVYYDAMSALAYKAAEIFVTLEHLYELTQVPTAVDSYLDDQSGNFAITRKAATAARYRYVYAGTRPEAGERFFANGGRYFALIEDGGALILVAEEAGEAANDILPGTAAVPVNNISGLTSSTFGELIEPGTEQEDDESLRLRVQQKIAGPAENGNLQQYKTWCEEVEGVGRAKIIPLFAGENTVLGVLVGADGKPAAEAVVERVQEYIDPATQGLTVEYEGETLPLGDGVGAGISTIGAHFTAKAATAVPIAISCEVELADGATLDDAKAQAEEALIAHLRELALETPENEEVVVRMSAVSAMLYGLPAIIDYKNLTMNGGTANIPVSHTSVAVLEEVTWTNEVV